MAVTPCDSQVVSPVLGVLSPSNKSRVIVIINQYEKTKTKKPSA